MPRWMLAPLLLALCGAGEPVPHPSTPQSYGVVAEVLRASLGGYALDFRYRVIDAEKARPLFDKKIKPYLIDHKTGVALGMPEDGKLGALRASPRNPPVAGKQYYVVFANSHPALPQASRVTIVIGGCRFEDMVVE